MILILVGTLLSVFNIYIEMANGGFLGLLPDFVGYILIYIGTGRLMERDSSLEKDFYNPLIALRFLVVLSILPWIADLLALGQAEMGLPVTLPALLLSILRLLVSLGFWLSFVGAMEQVEQERDLDLVTGVLKTAVILYKTVEALAVVCALLPLNGLLWVVALAGTASAVFFLAQVFRMTYWYQCGIR